MFTISRILLIPSAKYYLKRRMKLRNGCLNFFEFSKKEKKKMFSSKETKQKIYNDLILLGASLY